jgi:hypothetical protein
LNILFNGGSARGSTNNSQQQAAGKRGNGTGNGKGKRTRFYGSSCSHVMMQRLVAARPDFDAAYAWLPTQCFAAHELLAL